MANSSTFIEPSITFVGAGPGDPELISLKGIRALQRANVVLYDALVDESIRSFAPATAIQVYVGSPNGEIHFSQETVNQLMVDYAMNFGHVVRLKGGDLFVYGNVYEEMTFAESYSIPYAIVPGISSAMALPGLEGIPVTHPTFGKSLWVLSAIGSDGRLSDQIREAARSQATVVVMQGYAKRAEIFELFRQIGKGHLPAAAIQNGSLPNQKVVVGLVNTLDELIEEKGIDHTGPVLLIFGQVVRLHPDFQRIIRYFESPDVLDLH
jgi:uroporphyrin-III C-methyltransferase